MSSCGLIDVRARSDTANIPVRIRKLVYAVHRYAVIGVVNLGRVLRVVLDGALSCVARLPLSVGGRRSLGLNCVAGQRKKDEEFHSAQWINKIKLIDCSPKLGYRFYL